MICKEGHVPEDLHAKSYADAARKRAQRLDSLTPAETAERERQWQADRTAEQARKSASVMSEIRREDARRAEQKARAAGRSVVHMALPLALTKK